jgi:hypothetical protein
MWSDLFLASGAVIHFNNGDVTATHAANALAFAGATSGYTFDAGVGIGTSAPTHPLTVIGNTDGTAVGPVVVKSTGGSNIGTAFYAGRDRQHQRPHIQLHLDRNERGSGGRHLCLL